jgi:hypothetical protein
MNKRFITALLAIVAGLCCFCSSKGNNTDSELKTLNNQIVLLKNDNDKLIQDKNNLLSNVTDKLSDSRSGIWGLDTTSEDIRIQFNEEIKNVQIPEIIDKLNKVIPNEYNPKIKLKRIEGCKCFVKVIDAELLTQRMGTAGAEEYLASVTFSLTSVPGIHSVNFDFEEGDHAIPGDYSRDRFISLLK